MRILLFIICLEPSFALAQSRIIEFSVLNEGAAGIVSKYRAVWDDHDSKKDEIHRENHAGVWTRVFQGPLGYLEIPQETRLDLVHGDRIHAYLGYGSYSLEDGKKSVGLRIRSGSNLVLITPFGTVKVPWPGQVLDVVQLGRDSDRQNSTSFYIFSVKGKQSSNTYIVLNGEYDLPIKIMDGFRAEPFNAVMEEGQIRIPELNKTFDIKQLLGDALMMKHGREQARAVHETTLNRLSNTPLIFPPIPAEVVAIIRDMKAPGRDETMAALKAAPTSGAVVNELIAQLDDREPMASMANAQALAGQAIREILMREFPRLLELEKTDRVVKTHVDKVVTSITNMWLAHSAVSGRAIHDAIIQRLEAAMDRRAKCELSMTTLKGQGSHAASYYRSVALESLNTLYQKLYLRRPQ